MFQTAICWFFTFSPSEGFGVVHPFALGAEDLLYDVADAALAAGEGADVGADGFDFGGGIGGAAGEAAVLHDFVVGDVVAHVEDFLGTETALLEPLAEGVDFHAGAVVDVGEAEAFVALAHGWALAAGDDGHGIAEAGGVVEGVAVFDVGGAVGLVIVEEDDEIAAQHAVYVKAEGSDLGEVVVYHIGSPLPAPPLGECCREGMNGGEG